MKIAEIMRAALKSLENIHEDVRGREGMGAGISHTQLYPRTHGAAACFDHLHAVCVFNKQYTVLLIWFIKPHVYTIFYLLRVFQNFAFYQESI